MFNVISWAGESHHCFLLTPWRFSGSLCSVVQLTTPEKTIILAVYKGYSWKRNKWHVCTPLCLWGHTGTCDFRAVETHFHLTSCAGVKAELCLLTSAEDSAFMVSIRNYFKSHAAAAAEADQKWSGIMLCCFFVLGCTGLGAGVSNKRNLPLTFSLELDFQRQENPKTDKTLWWREGKINVRAQRVWNINVFLFLFFFLWREISVRKSP